MKKYRALWMNDLRHIRFDPMLMASMIGPLALTLIARYAFPPLSDWLEQVYGFRLSAYTAFIAAFLLIAIPLLPGTMAGLLMLDERDENMVVYFGVTPLARGGYFRYRLFLPSSLTFLFTGLFMPLSGVSGMRPESMYTVVILLLEAPLFALFLAAFASNKVEGLALSKASGLMFAGPVVAYFVPEPWTYLGVWIPTYWPAQSYLSGGESLPLASIGWFLGGVAYHVILLIWLLRRFTGRID